MGFLSTTRIVTGQKVLTRDELRELRDAIKEGRAWGSFSATLMSALGFVPGTNVVIGGLTFIIGLGMAYATLFQEGADDRCQELLDEDKDIYYVDVKMEFYYETIQELNHMHLNLIS